MNISAIDLFCGIGGLSYGLQKSGISVKVGVDIDNSCKFAFENNVKAPFIEADIKQISEENLKEFWGEAENVKVLVGCAPCQPFSTHSNKNKNKQKSLKWDLIKEFLRIIQETKPDIVSMENVPNLANQKIFTEFVTELKRAKYFVSYETVNCPDYGIPQKRKRLVLLASKYGEINLIPKTHTSENYVTLEQAIGHLPPIEAGKTDEKDPLHKARKLSETNIKRIQASKPNGTWEDWDEDLLLACHKKNSGKTYKSVYGRMSWDEPSSTITTQFYNYGTGRFGHPSQDRALSLREGALLQSFPQDYVFYDDQKDFSIAQLGIHIGNAVPVELGAVIGKSIQIHLGEYFDEEPKIYI